MPHTAEEKSRHTRTVVYPRHKARLANARSGGCIRCGSDKYLTFHHRDPVKRAHRTQRIVAAMTNHSDESFWAEVALCDVLCKKCHKAEHSLS